MNYRMVGRIIGRILITEACLMVLSMLVAIYYGDQSVSAFAITVLLLLAVGCILSYKKPKDGSIYAKEGFAIVALSWILMSMFGALPFFLSGAIPNYVDCFFETVSGFTTTGASILTNIEGMEKGLLFWRSFTHWIGGMGVLVFVMAILPMSDGHGMHLLRAEVPGPSVGKLVSKMSSSAKILYGIYLVLTFIEIIFLVAGGMPLFDALIHAFGTAGTGGFSSKAASVGAYNSVYFEVVITVFMLLFGINFNLFYFILIGRVRDVFRSEELRVYAGIVIGAIVLLSINLLSVYNSFATALRHSSFQVASIITTTGYATVDYNQWPAFSKVIIVFLTFTGACAGSTGGGMKIARVVMLFKTAWNDFRRILHPNAVSPVRFEEKPQSDKSLRSVHVFFTAYVVIHLISFLLISLEGHDLVTSFTAVTTCINNVGPGLNLVGPAGNFAFFSLPGKILLSFNMLIGRLEIFPILVLFMPSLWKRGHGLHRRLPD